MTSMPIEILCGEQHFDYAQLLAHAEGNKKEDLLALQTFFECVFKQFKEGYEVHLKPFLGSDDDLSIQVASALYRLIFKLLTNTNISLTREFISIMSNSREIFSTIYLASDIGNGQDLHQHIDQLKNKVSEEQFLYRHLLALSDYSGAYAVYVKHVVDQDTGLAMSVLIGLLTAHRNLFEDVDQNYFQWVEHLATLSHHGGQTFDFEVAVKALSPPWMNCSYAPDYQQKLKFKRAINTFFRHYLNDIRKQGLIADAYCPADRQHEKSRPRLMILAEVMPSFHAMYRCYSYHFESIQACFEVEFVSADAKTLSDHHIQQAFGEHIYSLENKSIPEMINFIGERRPDIILYPSLGMSTWAPVLCQERLAPVQMMMLGHPETSLSPHIDYVVGDFAVFEGIAEQKANVFSEHIIAVESQPAPIALSLWPTDYHPKTIERTPGVIKIAVVGVYRKMNYALLAVLRMIEAQSTLPIEFHFFSGTQNLTHVAATKIFNQLFKMPVNQGHQDYGEYLQNIGACDFAIGAFPFGNTNSIADAILVNIPLFFLNDFQPFSRTDYQIYKAVGLPEALSCDDVNQLIEKVLYYTANSEALAALRAETASCIPKLYNVDKRNVDLFAKAMLWAYEHHDEIQSGGAKMTCLTEAILRETK